MTTAFTRNPSSLELPLTKALITKALASRERDLEMVQFPFLRGGLRVAGRNDTLEG